MSPDHIRFSFSHNSDKIMSTEFIYFQEAIFLKVLQDDQEKYLFIHC